VSQPRFARRFPQGAPDREPPASRSQPQGWRFPQVAFGDRFPAAQRREAERAAPL